MFPRFPEFRALTNKDRRKYNFFYFLQDEPNSDYCFSVIRTWLAYNTPVHVSQIDDELIVVRYNDVLLEEEDNTLYAIIGNHNRLKTSKVKKLLALTDQDTKLVLSYRQLNMVENELKSDIEIISDLGLNDYIYSVKDYVRLDKPDYRRIRREISIFNRTHPELKTSIKKLNINNPDIKKQIINAHHCWEDTYKYHNDPDRVEGEIIARIIENSKDLGIKCAVGLIDNEIEGIFLYSDLPMKSGHYVNLHHARFSYKYKFINDYQWVQFAKLVDKEGVEYINFERDANIEGLRQHKQLLRPVEVHSMHLVAGISKSVSTTRK